MLTHNAFGNPGQELLVLLLGNGLKNNLILQLWTALGDIADESGIVGGVVNAAVQLTGVVGFVSLDVDLLPRVGNWRRVS